MAVDGNFTLLYGLAQTSHMISDRDALFEIYVAHRNNIVPMLEAGLLSGSWDDIRSLTILQRPATLSRPVGIVFDSIETQKRATKLAWKAVYQGREHELLETNIRTMNKERNDHTSIYANMVSIIQSSGTGKSRMVHELARRVFTLPFNLRTRHADIGGAYPKPDDDVRHYFVSRKVKQSKFELTPAYSAFFVALFDAVAGILLSWSTYSTEEELALAWRNYLEPNERGQSERDSLYERATAEALKVLANMNAPRATNEKRTFSEIVKERLRSSAQGLQDALRAKVAQKGQKSLIVLYFDEAHELHGSSEGGSSFKTDTQLSALCATLDLLKQQDMFSIFISTNPSLSRFAPPVRERDYTRVPALFQPPITELPSGKPGFVVIPSVCTVADVKRARFMANLGRALFWTRLDAYSSMEDSVIDFAEQKLAGMWPSPNDHDAPLASLAVLSCRLNLDIDPSLEAGRRIQAELVARRMATAYSIPSHGEYMHSGYPSEPLLAEAAARRMAKIRVHDHEENGRGDAMARKLLPHLRSGLVDKGERRELVARLLLMLTQDKAVEAQHARAKELSTAHGKVLYSSEVPVNDFMKTLLPYAWEEIRQSTPDNCDGQTFENAFNDAVVRFTHFGRAGDDYAVSSAAACAAFIRGMAFQRRSGQGLIGIMVPVLLKRSAKLGEEVMSGIFISIRDSGPASRKARVVDETEISFFPREEDATVSPRPYIALALELNTQLHTPRATKTTVDLMDEKHQSKGTVIKKARAETDVSTALSKADAAAGAAPSEFTSGASPNVHPRYTIFVHGCSPSVYGVVEDKSIFAEILAWDEPLADHGRQDPQSLDAVRRMKPFWTNGSQCYGWIDVPYLQYPAQVSAVEGVSTTGPLVAGDDDNLPQSDSASI